MIKKVRRWWQVRQWERLLSQLSPDERMRLNQRMHNLCDGVRMTGVSCEHAGQAMKAFTVATRDTLRQSV